MSVSKNQWRVGATNAPAGHRRLEVLIVRCVKATEDKCYGDGADCSELTGVVSTGIGRCKLFGCDLRGDGKSFFRASDCLRNDATIREK